MKTCTVDACDRTEYARELCLRHYRRRANTGSATDLRALKRRPSDVSLEEWFWSRVDKAPAGCWTWTAAHNSAGYGQMWDGAKVAYAHRLAYQFTFGRVDDGMEIDHSCRVRNCVNPEHLQVATRKVNMENVVNNLGSASGVRGVHKVRGGRWRAAVGHNGVNHSGGEYGTIEEAEQAAIELRNQLFTNNVPDHVSPRIMRPMHRWEDD